MKELKITRHNIFLASIFLKGLNGILEIFGGILTLAISPTIVKNIVNFLVLNEITEDPKDLVANYFLHIFSGYNFKIQIFWAFYLFIHGVIKIFLVIALWERKLWAYPTAIAIFFAFIAYQAYRYTFSFSPFLIILSIFDIFVIIMTYFEYKSLKNKIYLEK
jgi:uncharacterized membrane protein